MGVVGLKDTVDIVNYAKIGKRIKIARIEKDLSQTGLARLVGCTNNYISRIEGAQTRISPWSADATRGRFGKRPGLFPDGYAVCQQGKADRPRDRR